MAYNRANRDILMQLFPKDYEALKIYIDKAIQKNQDYVCFKGIMLHLTVAKRMYENYIKTRDI